MPPDAISFLYTDSPAEDSDEHAALVDKWKFSYRSLLGELMYAYVTCRPDIGYAITTLSKFSHCPADYHFRMLKKVTRYLHRTKSWGPDRLFSPLHSSALYTVSFCSRLRLSRCL